jgi:hypothetical protein|tara:strand:- start:418 stop:774 length:357 start_codon:yes stop_codon:yes gene_type:complete
LFFGWSLSEALSAPPSVSQVSSQRGHIIESSRYKASRPGGGLSYLRLVDRADQSTVFRSSLFTMRSMDMGARADSKSTGVIWVAVDIAASLNGTTSSSAIHPMSSCRTVEPYRLEQLK